MYNYFYKYYYIHIYIYTIDVYKCTGLCREYYDNDYI